MENFNEASIVVSEKVAIMGTALKNRIDEESISNYKHVITQISNAFEKATASDNIETKKESLKIIENYENYLGEKYRDDADQRSYITSVKEAMTYLRNIIE